MKIVILDGYTLNPGDLDWSKLNEIDDRISNIKIYDRIDALPNTKEYAEEVIEKINNAEIVLTNKTVIDKYIIDNCPFIKYIGVLATGYNVVDIEYAKEKNIVVTNIPTYGTKTVAQFTMSLILELANGVGVYNQSVKNGEWNKSKDFCYYKTPMIELDGKTLGVIGFGAIGKATAQIAQAFGMKVIAYKRNIDKNLESKNIRFANDLEDLLINSDIVSLHCPLSESTKGIINKNTLSKMKKSAFLINTSRGLLVKDDELADALNEGVIAGCALDVVSYEPIKADNPLLNAKNCIMTPHVAWASVEARSRLLDIAIDNIRAYIDGNIMNKIN